MLQAMWCSLKQIGLTKLCLDLFQRFQASHIIALASVGKVEMKRKLLRRNEQVNYRVGNADAALGAMDRERTDYE